MKWPFIAFPTLLLMFCLGSNEMSSNTNIIKEQRESYEACIRLRKKAPYFNLNCERLIPIIETTINKNEINNNKGIKTLSEYESSTKKVSKTEEIKLRNLLLRLSRTNKLRNY